MFPFKNHKAKSSPAIEEFHSSSDAVALRAKLENERLSRRQVLRKMGVTAGIMLVAMPSIDEPARLMSRRA